MSAVGCDGHSEGLDDVLLREIPSSTFPQTSDFNGMIRYRGLDVSPEPAIAGQSLKLVHYWDIVAPPGRGWTILVRLQGTGQSDLIADHDAASGRYPVSRWGFGEMVRDEQTLMLPSNWPSKARVIVGIVNGPAELPITVGSRQTEGRLVAGTFPVRRTPP